MGFNYHNEAMEKASFACATLILVRQVNKNEFRMGCLNLAPCISKCIDSGVDFLIPFWQLV